MSAQVAILQTQDQDDLPNLQPSLASPRPSWPSSIRNRLSHTFQAVQFPSVLPRRSNAGLLSNDTSSIHSLPNSPSNATPGFMARRRQQRVSILRSKSYQRKQDKGNQAAELHGNIRRVYVKCKPQDQPQGMVRRLSRRVSIHRTSAERPGTAQSRHSTHTATTHPRSSTTSLAHDFELPSITYFSSNQIRTSKYTFWSFIPKNLFEQFRRAANVYFLFMAILQMIPYFNVNNPVLVLFPICFVLAVTAIKDGFEDAKRKRQDKEMNESMVKRWQGGGWVNIHAPQEQSESFCQRLRHRFLPTSHKKASEVNVYVINSASSPNGQIIRQSSSSIGSFAQTPTLAQVNDVAHTQDHDEPQRPSLSRRPTFRQSATFSVKHPPKTPSDAGFHPVQWQDLYPGDLVFLPNNASVPADLLVLACSSEDGECFVETKNLDGETNLKPRKSVDEVLQLVEAENHRVAGVNSSTSDFGDGIPSAGVGQLRCYLECEQPSSNLYVFHGTLYLRSNEALDVEDSRAVEDDQGVETVDPDLYRAISVDNSNMLLRGCVLRNTSWIIGLVVYTGHESKIMLNSGGTPSKQSRIERTMNRQVIFNFALLILLCIICAVLNGYYQGVWNQTQASALWAGGDLSSGEAAFVTFWYVCYLFLNKMLTSD